MITTTEADRGGIRWGDGQEASLADATQSYCLLATGCACPGTHTDSLPVSQARSTDVFVAVGPSPGGGPRLAARSLASWCQEVLVPPPAPGSIDPCLAASWTTRGYVAPQESGVATDASGGSGAVITFGADRSVRVDMSQTEPVVLTATLPDGSTTTTTLTYRGSGAGTWSADAGVVDVTGLDTSSFSVLVSIEDASGVTTQREYTGADVGSARFAGLLGTGRYQCTPVSLLIAHVVAGIGTTAAFELSPS